MAHFAGSSPLHFPQSLYILIPTNINPHGSNIRSFHSWMVPDSPMHSLLAQSNQFDKNKNETKNKSNLGRQNEVALLSCQANFAATLCNKCWTGCWWLFYTLGAGNISLHSIRCEMKIVRGATNEQILQQVVVSKSTRCCAHTPFAGGWRTNGGVLNRKVKTKAMKTTMPASYIIAPCVLSPRMCFLGFLGKTLAYHIELARKILPGDKGRRGVCPMETPATVLEVLA